MRLNNSTKCVICGKDLPMNMTQLLLGLKGNSACLQHEESKELYEWVIRHQKQELEALKQENEQLKADCDRMLGEVQELTMEYNHFKERLQISPHGDDKIDELDEALENCKFQYEQLKQENEQLQAQLDEWKYEAKCHMDEVIAREKQIEQLQAQAARVRAALTIANNYMPDIGQFCVCGKCKGCGTDIGYSGYEYCLKCVRGIIDAALSDTPADYHNPADMEALRKAREALCKGISELKVHCKYFDNTPEEDACIEMHEAILEIDKVIGGGQDV